MSRPQYTEKEAKQRGREIVEREVCPKFVPTIPREFVIVDPETEEYVVGGDFMEVINALYSKNPGVHLFAYYIGSPENGRIIRRLYSYNGLSYATPEGNPTQEMIDVARRCGEERYQQIRRQVEPDNERKIVVINTQTSEYAVGDDLGAMLKPVHALGVIAYFHRIGFLGYRSLGYRATLGVLRSRNSKDVSASSEIHLDFK